MKRCLYCPALCSTLNLSADTAYRKDFLLIGGDVATHHHCPYCDVFHGTQLAIDQHLDTTCPDMVVLCACGTVRARREMEAHIPYCTEREECGVCHLFVLGVEMEDHMMNVHHHMRCTLCGTYVAYHVMTLHIMDDCPFRTVHCDYCHGAVQFGRMAQHMEEHESYFQSTFLRLMRSMTTALRDYNQFRRARRRLLS